MDTEWIYLLEYLLKYFYKSLKEELQRKYMNTYETPCIDRFKFPEILRFRFHNKLTRTYRTKVSCPIVAYIEVANM